MSRGSDFWSRRKARVRAEEDAEARARAAAELAETRAELEEKSDADVLAELELPDPDSLEPGDDFSGFMAKAVPERIRRRALRRLWLSNPTLANLDSLVDYGEDYTGSGVAEVVRTAYQVGKGMKAHVEELARQAEAEAEAEAAAADPASGTTETGTPDEPGESHADDAAVAAAAPETETGPDAQPAQTAWAGTDEDAPAPALPRRMRFSFAS
ncbi:DUF3306 domain-containing protein [Rhodovulum sp. YNF3179]|uniref:DUF3306 domain-containing protein n=1 Tax=Rhodovulum sp. YNF3179 TaxID=3425127 RepID=UPI003D3462FC